MKELPKSLFDVYALALPRGHGFGSAQPIGAWQSDDGLAYTVITHNDGDSIFGVQSARPRMDQTWAIIFLDDSFSSYEEAFSHFPALLREILGTQYIFIEA